MACTLFECLHNMCQQCFERQHCLLDCRTISANLVSAQPSLATVPEGSTINTGLSTGMPAMHYTSDALVPTEDLSSMSVEELQAELIRTRQAFHSAGTLHNLPQALDMVCCQLHGKRHCLALPVVPSSQSKSPQASVQQQPCHTGRPHWLTLYVRHQHRCSAVADTWH